MKSNITIQDVKKIDPHNLEIVCVPSKDNPNAKIEVIDCSEYSTLVQSIGYLKYAMPGPVFYRGQTQLFGTGSLKASIYRDNDPEKNERLQKLLMHLAESSDQTIWSDYSLNTFEANQKVGKNRIFHDVPLYGLEGVLQHYGINTRWLDITDSLSHALFFSLAQYRKLKITKPFSREHSPQTGGSCCSRLMKNMVVNVEGPENRHCYLIALSPGKLCTNSVQNNIKGLSEYDEGFVLDARTAIPSQYLRPHAQHGLLYRPKRSNAIERIFIFRLHVEKVKQWIGTGLAVSPSTIFPPIRSLNACKPCPNPTKSADKGLNDIEKNLIRLWKASSDNGNYLTGVYSPLSDLTNFVTQEELDKFECFSRLENPSRRVDWNLSKK